MKYAVSFAIAHSAYRPAITEDAAFWRKILKLNKNANSAVSRDEQVVEWRGLLDDKRSPLLVNDPSLKKEFDSALKRRDRRVKNSKRDADAGVIAADLEKRGQREFSDFAAPSFTKKFFDNHWEFSYSEYVVNQRFDQKALEAGILLFLGRVRKVRQAEVMKQRYAELFKGKPAAYQGALAGPHSWEHNPPVAEFLNEVDRKIAHTQNLPDGDYLVRKHKSEDDPLFQRFSPIGICEECEADISSFRRHQQQQFDHLSNKRRLAVAFGKLDDFSTTPMMRDEYGDIPIGDKTWEQNLRGDVRNAYIVTYEGQQFVRKVSPDGPDHTGIETLGPEVQNLRDLTGHDNMVQFYNYAHWRGVDSYKKKKGDEKKGDFGIMDMEYGLFTLGKDVNELNSDAIRFEGVEGGRIQGHLLYDYLRALFWMQRRGMKHCDIKPANLVVVKNPETGKLYGKLIDLGVSAPRKDSCFAFTRHFAFQVPVEDEKQRRRTGALALKNYDIYALGLSMLYAMGVEAESPIDGMWAYEEEADEGQMAPLIYRADMLRKRILEKENFWFANLPCSDRDGNPRFDLSRDLLVRMFPENPFSPHAERETALEELLDHECWDSVRVAEVDGRILAQKGELAQSISAQYLANEPLIMSNFSPSPQAPVAERRVVHVKMEKHLVVADHFNSGWSSKNGKIPGRPVFKRGGVQVQEGVYRRGELDEKGNALGFALIMLGLIVFATFAGFDKYSKVRHDFRKVI